MSTTVDVTFHCDAPKCRVKFDAYCPQDSDDAEDQAREAGWVFREWKAYCPKCTRPEVKRARFLRACALWHERQLRAGQWRLLA